jgi:putative ABC transport system permease protein
MPREFRLAHGEDAVDLFGDLYSAAYRRGGRSAVVHLWKRSLLQVVMGAVAERLEAVVPRRQGRRPSTPAGRRQHPMTRLKAMPARVLQDLRFAARSFAKKPGFSVTAIVILALGVGATTTIFSVVDGILLDKLPYPDPDRLVYFDHPSHTPPDYVDWRGRTTSFSAMAATWGRDVDLTNDGAPARLRAGLVTRDFFQLFGAAPLLGRLLVHDDFATTIQVVVLSYGLWQRRWGGDPDIIGRRLTINAEPVVVVGVLGPNFATPEALVGRNIEIWTPLNISDPEIQSRSLFILSVAARLHTAASRESAQAELSALAEVVAEENPETNRRRDGTARPFEIMPLYEATVGDAGKALYMLLGAVGLMLLIACANVANLFLARGTDRAREIALRVALGAGRGRIVTQLLTESVALALVGGGLGIGIAYLAVEAFAVYDPGGIPRVSAVTVNIGILVFALSISIATGVLFGIVPALQAARTDVTEALKDSAGSVTAGRGRFKVRNALVVAEIAMALVLLVGAGLLFKSFMRLVNVDPGFETEQLVTIPLTLGPPYTTERRVRFTENLVERIAALPGTEDVAAGWTLPFVFHGGPRCCWMDVIQQTPAVDDPPATIIHPVTPGYFRVLRGTLTRGREFAKEDREATPTPTVVNATLAKRLFGENDAVGQSLHMDDAELTIVGVVSDIRHWGLNENINNELYVPYAEFGGDSRRLHVMLRSRRNVADIASALRDAVWSLDPNLPVDEIITMRQRVSTSVAAPRFYSMLLSVFAGVAILLAAGGIYGSILYSVGQRHRELGIRLALGARSNDVVRLIVRHGLALTALGIGLGLAGAYAVSRTLQSLVFGISTTDGTTFAAVSVFLATVALAASYVPARRAGRTDPMETLKAE